MLCLSNPIGGEIVFLFFVCSALLYCCVTHSRCLLFSTECAIVIYLSGDHFRAIVTVDLVVPCRAGEW